MATADADMDHILCVDDEPGLADLVGKQLELKGDCIVATGVTCPEAALDYLAGHAVDAIVSDFDMPAMTGLDLLESVRADYPSLPFILYTGKGSEEIASEAIRMGVTEYMQKETGTDQYSVLVNRVQNAVRRYRAEDQVDTERSRFQGVFEQASDAMIIASNDGTYLDVNAAACELFGRSEEELLGRTAADFTIEDFDFDTVWDSFRENETDHGVFPVRRPDGSIRIAQYAATANIVPGKHLSVLRDITQRREYEKQIRQEQERLQEFAGVLSHDLKNPVAVAHGHIDLLKEHVTDEQADALSEVEDAVSRIDHIIDDVLSLSQQDGIETEMTPVAVSAVATDVWQRVQNGRANATIKDGVSVRADEGLVERLLTNLFRNAIEHGGATVSIEFGGLESGDGFYVQDDGPGIPLDAREEVFEWKYSTKNGGTGIGLKSIQQIVESHGWTITITESTTGGARFEIVT
ncbi:hybrid sensor histidine kinase/response regulator [Natrarchaeobius chitinivorans]|uniref:histidine kinase n=1 Tax=Natrarchaeobius chitinivorans TaxID=1679083 RepID=A0A3N6LKZ2_NATCH|nr:response regulator [Natrarchaeobius chitinivorans]RQG89553.1 response regulator [Natrarchaeobius chitinivorans]